MHIFAADGDVERPPCGNVCSYGNEVAGHVNRNKCSDGAGCKPARVDSGTTRDRVSRAQQHATCRGAGLADGARFDQ